MKEHDIAPIDMTILNLYPFEETIKKPGCTFAQAVENIDIGGPSMLRSTAKNHAFTSIVTSPDQYKLVQETMEANGGGTTMALRQKLAAAAFALSASYDSMIANYFSKTLDTESPVVTRVYKPEFPLKYGCNPQQQPATYRGSAYMPAAVPQDALAAPGSPYARRSQARLDWRRRRRGESPSRSR